MAPAARSARVLRREGGGEGGKGARPPRALSRLPLRRAPAASREPWPRSREKPLRACALPRPGPGPEEKSCVWWWLPVGAEIEETCRQDERHVGQDRGDRG